MWKFIHNQSLLSALPRATRSLPVLSLRLNFKLVYYTLQSGSNIIVVIHPDMFETDTDSQEQEEQLLVQGQLVGDGHWWIWTCCVS